MCEAVVPVQLEEVRVNHFRALYSGILFLQGVPYQGLMPITSLPTCHWSGALHIPFYTETCQSLAPVNWILLQDLEILHYCSVSS